MYLDFFSLQRHPFRITPDPSLFFAGGAHGRGVVLDALIYAITSGEGILKVVGEVGSGKTMLCRMLEERLPATVEIVYLANPSLSARDIVYAIAFELKLEVDAKTDRLIVMQKLQEYLLAKHGAGNSVVVFIEEAQSMPLETLEEVRLLSNLETHRHKLLQIVLFGQPELDEKLADKAIRQLRERITHSFYLQPFSEENIREYLHFRLQAAGCPWPQLFSPDAEKLIAKASAGLSRRINILADKSLLAAYADPATRPERRSGTGEPLPVVQVSHVKTAIADSGYAKESDGKWRQWALRALAAVVLIGVGALLSRWWQAGFEQAETLVIAGGDQETAAVMQQESLVQAAQDQAARALAEVSGATASIAVNGAEQTQTVTASSLAPAPESTPASSVVSNDGASAASVVSPAESVSANPAVPSQSVLFAERQQASIPWVVGLPSRTGYTVQMYAGDASDTGQLQSYLGYLNTLGMLDDVYVCQVPASGGRAAQWVVLHELFAGYSNAVNFIDALPEYLRKFQPYVRDVTGISCTK